LPRSWQARAVPERLVTIQQEGAVARHPVTNADVRLAVELRCGRNSGVLTGLQIPFIGQQLAQPQELSDATGAMTGGVLRAARVRQFIVAAGGVGVTAVTFRR